MQRNLLKMFDVDGDNQISLIEFEKQMSKYLDTGKVKVPQTIADIDSKIISDEIKKELVLEMQAEVKKTVDFESFSLKPLGADDLKKKEALILEALRKGQLPEEKISGEVKIQFDEGTNLMSIVGKAIPLIGITITSYTPDG